jgi:DNA-binding GntR family transcriptional regulator
MIVRRPGAGTTVVASAPVSGYPGGPVTQDIATLAAGSESCAELKKVKTLDRAQAARVGAAAGSVWFLVEGPRYRRSDPDVALCWSEQYLRSDLPRTAVVRGEFTAAEVARFPVTQTISAGVLSSRHAAALDCEPGSAALVIARRNRDDQGRLISVGIHTHPAERYSITTHHLILQSYLEIVCLYKEIVHTIEPND